jgi:predicted acylesterase/phospholipase RssA
VRKGDYTFRRRPLLYASWLVGAALWLSGCGAPQRLDAVPSALAGDISFVDVANSRFDGDNGVALMQEIRRSLGAERARGFPNATAPSFLALSGGGEDGAFGAGLLVGWSEHGDRPQFKIVSGTSTGALAAPFAFLGGEFDWALEKMYTTTEAEDVATKRYVVAAVSNDALMDNAPLYATISKYVDGRLLERIAEEYGKGRLLLISTTNLDIGKPVIWNIGAIAASRHPRRLELVRKIILASAAVPGLLPPVMIDVMIGKTRHQEMHVDGGTVSQVFLYPAALEMSKMIISAKNGARPAAYIIRNSRVVPMPEKVERQALAIAGRAIETLIASNGVGDLYRIYTTAQRDHIDFNLAIIGEEFKEPSKGYFDRDYMTKLFTYGRAQGRRGYAWQKVPPGYSRR